MDDLAPVSLRGTSDEVGRRPENLIPGPKKLPKKARPMPAEEPSPDAGMDPDHQLDVLA
jgi:hypothetical protein